MKKAKANELQNAPVDDNIPTWLEDLLFKFPLEHTVEAPLETTAAALQAIAIKRENMFQIRSRTVEITPQSAGRQTFVVKALRRGRSLDVTAAIARGELVEDGDSTRIRGYTRFAVPFLLSLLLPIILGVMILVWLVGLIFFEFFFGGFSFGLVALLVVGGLTYRQFRLISDDRDALRAALRDLDPSKPKRKGK